MTTRATTVVGRLADDGCTHPYVDGGEVIQQFLAADPIDAMTITVAAVLLGEGIRLFGDLPADRAFRPDPPQLLGELVQTTWHRRR